MYKCVVRAKTQQIPTAVDQTMRASTTERKKRASANTWVSFSAEDPENGHTTSGDEDDDADEESWSDFTADDEKVAKQEEEHTRRVSRKGARDDEDDDVFNQCTASADAVHVVESKIGDRIMQASEKLKLLLESEKSAYVRARKSSSSSRAGPVRSTREPTESERLSRKACREIDRKFEKYKEEFCRRARVSNEIYESARQDAERHRTMTSTDDEDDMMRQAPPPIRAEVKTKAVAIPEVYMRPTKSACWFDCGPIDGFPLPGPTGYSRERKRVHIGGFFCSWACVRTYTHRDSEIRARLAQQGVTVDQLIVCLQEIYSKIFGSASSKPSGPFSVELEPNHYTYAPTVLFRPQALLHMLDIGQEEAARMGMLQAPRYRLLRHALPVFMLQHFGGPMTVEQYRKNSMGLTVMSHVPGNTECMEIITVAPKIGPNEILLGSLPHGAKTTPRQQFPEKLHSGEHLFCGIHEIGTQRVDDVAPTSTTGGPAPKKRMRKVQGASHPFVDMSPPVTVPSNEPRTKQERRRREVYETSFGDDDGRQRRPRKNSAKVDQSRLFEGKIGTRISKAASKFNKMVPIDNGMTIAKVAQ